MLRAVLKPAAMLALAVWMIAACGSEKANRRTAETLLPPGAEVVNESDCGDHSTTDCYQLEFRHTYSSQTEAASVVRAEAETKGWKIGEDCNGPRTICFYLRKAGFLAHVVIGPTDGYCPANRGGCKTYISVEGR